MKPAIVNLSLLLAIAGAAHADRMEQWSERVRSVVAVEFVVDGEAGKKPTTTFGVAIDRRGTVALPTGAVDLQIPVAQLKDFTAYPAGGGEGTGFPAQYLGADAYTGWSFVRVDPALAARLVPVQGAGPSPGDASGPRLGSEVWGIALRSHEEDFQPYLLQTHVAMTAALPRPIVITQANVAGPGLPVFDNQGRFAGLAASSFGQTYLQFSPGNRGGSPVMLVDLEESSAFVPAAEALVAFSRLPARVDGRPIGWIGVGKLSPMVGGGVQVGYVALDSPAARAGLEQGDVVLAVDGTPLTRIHPAGARPEGLLRQIIRRRPGDTIQLTELAAASAGVGPTGPRVLTVAVQDAPKLPREADRRMLDRLGFAVREVVESDLEGGYSPDGAIVYFVAGDGPAAASGLAAGDEIVAADEVPLTSFVDAAARLSALAGDPKRSDVPLRVWRAGASVLVRIRLGK